ncbi:hypothetical protein Pyrfu_1001 [Pyrolobus fumarii 1A]|uniref:Uncharacterized protein n=1 Tax=Pyrolobus fumarii (strain DSM 11204 / 1A) TaxID=694429 RepID=G0EEP7_PYRF1|nr:Snf7 family protein [Pyrolobus fumarii]AEM38869.1 hypothetical protein Pyrfu_1001 [Pyrolobus fumarii 1A]
MADLRDFAKNWAPEKKPGIGSKIKKMFKREPPLRLRIVQAIHMLKVQTHRLEYMIARMKERDQELFERVVEAQMEGDKLRAQVYANEVAEIRKVVKTLMTAKLALERVILRLETITSLSDAVVALAPVVGVVRELKTQLMGIVPEIALEIAEVGELLESLVIETGEYTAIASGVGAVTPEAKKILQEAATIAEQRLREEFPTLPEIPASTTAEGAKAENG